MNPQPTSADEVTIQIEMPRRASIRLRAAHWILRRTVRRLLDTLVWAHQHHLIGKRLAWFVLRQFDRLLLPLRPPRGTVLQRADFASYRAEWVWDPSVADAPESRTGAVLYFHGGGLVCCGLNSHRRIVARVSASTGLPVLNVEYRQIPEVAVEQTVGDCLAAYRRLLDDGFAPDRIVIAGDSAGGGLVFATCLAIRRAGLPQPKALVAIAPFANYDGAARRNHPNNRTDAALSAAILDQPVQWGMRIDGHLDAALSPVNHDFTGLPSTLIQAGSTEVLLADAYQVAAACVRADVPVRLQVWDRAIHVFHAGADVLPDARDAFNEIGAFVRDALDRSDPRGLSLVSRRSA